MTFQKGCYYCEQNPDFRELLFEICELRIAKVFLCKDQTLPGRCTIMFNNGHYDEIFQIPKAERDLFMDDVCTLAETIQEMFSSDKINYAIYGDHIKHVHFTLCPKYQGKLGFGQPFVLFPDPMERIYLAPEEYEDRISALRTTLLAKI